MSETSTSETKLGPWVSRPLVRISPEVIPFWEGLKVHEFRLCRCRRCGTDYYPYTVCIKHPDIPDFTEMEWTATSGRGAVYAQLNVRRVIDPDYEAELPYVLILVKLDEGPIFSARMVDCMPEQVHIGSRVRVKFYDVPSAGHTLPFFVLDDAAA